MPYLRHDSGGPAELKSRQILGSESPLEFDENGYAEIDDQDTADNIVAAHRHVEHAGSPPAQETGESDGEAFDAETFIDRTPMDDVVEDIQAGEADDHLGDVLEAEEDGRDRNGVTEAIEARRDELEG